MGFCKVNNIDNLDFVCLFVLITMIKMMYNLALVFSPELQQPQLRGVGGALKLMHRRRSKFGW